MDRLETGTHSFVIRVWIEEPAAGLVAWRGHITHVPDGERHYLQYLQEIPAFIAPYLRAMGVETAGQKWAFRLKVVLDRMRRWWL